MTKPGLVKSSSPLAQLCWKTSVSTPKATADRGQVEHRGDQRERHAAERERPSSAASAAARSRSPAAAWRAAGRRSRGTRPRPPPTAYVALEHRRAPRGAEVVAQRADSVVRRAGPTPRTAWPGSSTEVRPSAETLRPARGPATNSPVPVAVSLQGRAAPRPRRPGRPQSPRRRPSWWRPRPGTPRSARVNVCTSGMSAGRVSRLASWIFMPRAGSRERATTTPESSSATTGRRSTGASSRPADAAAADPAVEPPQQRDPRAGRPSGRA